MDKTTRKRAQFRSVVKLPWYSRSPKVTAVLPISYSHGLSTDDFVPVLEGLFGAGAGLSASVVT